MSQVSHLKSIFITNLDASPPVANTVGEGAAGPLRSIEGYATPLAADSSASTYQLVRLPTNAKVKSVDFESAAQGAGTIDLSVYYSDNALDGTPAAVATTPPTIVPTTGSQFFAAAINCASAVGITNETNQAGNYPINKRTQPLWKALGLTADPGGFFDVVAVVGATAITTGTGLLGVRVSYVE